MAGTAVFQSNTLATPGAGIVVHTDAVNGTVVQIVKFDIGPAGTTLPMHYALGTGLPVAGVGTFQALGTYQPLAGSVHVANTISGTVQTHGTSQVLGTVQTVGTRTVVGTVQAHGTSQVLGTVQTHGTSQALGTFQPLAGSVHPAAALPGTSQISGTVRTLAATGGLGESMFGTLFTAGVTNGTLIPAPGQGTYVRVYDLIVSGSAAGTAFVEFGDGTAFAPIMAGSNGGFVFNSTRGVRTRGTNMDILFNAASGSWGVSVNYVLEN